jgi:hypothetical protein
LPNARFLREGDTLIVTKPDRLARTTAELLRIEADLTQRGVGLVRRRQIDQRDPAHGSVHVAACGRGQSFRPMKSAL